MGETSTGFNVMLITTGHVAAQNPALSQGQSRLVAKKAWESFDLEVFCKECFFGRHLPLLAKPKKGRNI